MKAYIAQVTTPQPQPTSSTIPVDPVILFWITLGGGTGALITKYFPEFLKAANFERRVEARLKERELELTAKINQKQAETNAELSGRLTDFNIEKQKEEATIDINSELSATVAGLAKETVGSIVELLKGSIGSAQLYAEASVATNKATEHLADATKDLIDAFNALTLAQSQSQSEIIAELKRVKAGQDDAQEHLATSVTEILAKLTVIIDELGNLKTGNRVLEDKVLKAITEEIAKLRGELMSAISSLEAH